MRIKGEKMKTKQLFMILGNDYSIQRQIIIAVTEKEKVAKELMQVLNTEENRDEFKKALQDASPTKAETINKLIAENLVLEDLRGKFAQKYNRYINNPNAIELDKIDEAIQHNEKVIERDTKNLDKDISEIPNDDYQGLLSLLNDKIDNLGGKAVKDAVNNLHGKEMVNKYRIKLNDYERAKKSIQNTIETNTTAFPKEIQEELIPAFHEILDNRIRDHQEDDDMYSPLNEDEKVGRDQIINDYLDKAFEFVRDYLRGVKKSADAINIQSQSEPQPDKPVEHEENVFEPEISVDNRDINSGINEQMDRQAQEFRTGQD